MTAPAPVVSDKARKVKAINSGTVIDHIPGGLGLKVLNLLNLNSRTVKSPLSLLMAVPSVKLGMKDILKVEDRELAPEEVNLIALIAPKASICIIREGELVQKFPVTVPDRIHAPFRCPNRSCITNSLTKQGGQEPVSPEYQVMQREPSSVAAIRFS